MSAKVRKTQLIAGSHYISLSKDLLRELGFNDNRQIKFAQKRFSDHIVLTPV